MAGPLALCFMALSAFLQAERAEFLVGSIIIEGNTDTPDRVILDRLQLLSGQKLKLADVRAAQARLRISGLFKVNPWRGSGPTVELLPNEFDGVVRDVRVRVEERRTNR